MTSAAAVKKAEKLTRAEALAVAEAWAELLRTRFGARRVILFGSLVGQGPWHDGSDIDLAVEGLPSEDFFRAYSACHDLVISHGLDLDLVSLEDAYPEMRARILGEVEMPDDPILTLKSLVEDELIALERVVQEMQELLNECAQPPTRTELRAMATMLHEFYTGIESIFERIGVVCGEDLPRGEYWHYDLLNRMAEAQEGVRPAVISGPLRAHLEDCLEFRQFFRRTYGYTLEWNKMRWKVEVMAETLARLREQLQVFFEAVMDGQRNGEK